MDQCAEVPVPVQSATSTSKLSLSFTEIDGEKISQSIPIARYLARRFNLIGKDDLDAYRCDALVDAMQDLREAYSH
ncbi:unnamed protein product, partial [Rotaria magnacalcarata]